MDPDDGRGQLLQTLEGHEDSVNSVAWSPDGRTLASGSGDNWGGEGDDTIKLWAVEEGRGELLQTLVGHENNVNSVAWSPDGRTLASGSEDRTIKLWAVDREGGGVELLQTLEGHGDSVLSVAWSPDGRTLASGSEDRTIKLWPEWVTRHPCSWVYANLTPAQWLQFVGRSVYGPICPDLPSEPVPSIVESIKNGNWDYLLITWPGRLVVLGMSLIGLVLVGLLLWGFYLMLRSRTWSVVTAIIVMLIWGVVDLCGVYIAI